MLENPDHELMLQVKAGRLEQLAVLFERHHLKLFNFFRKSGNSRPASEDLVQDTFMRMLKYAASYQESRNFMPWMYQIARNVAADAGRNAVHAGLQDAVEPDVLAADSMSDPETQQSLHDTEQRLRRALLRLSSDKRELVLLSRVRQLGTEDLARLFGCSASVIKVRLHRSLEQLREYFDNEDDQHPGS